jgi:hypothetical protein
MHNRSPSCDTYISVEESALRSEYSTNYIRHLARTGRLGARRVNGSWLIEELGLQAYLSNRPIRSQRGRPRKT